MLRKRNHPERGTVPAVAHRAVFVLATLAIAGGAICVGGCARDPAVRMYAVQYRGRTPNLALSHRADVTALALEFDRSEWPSVDVGYRFEDAVEYNTFGVEYQSNFDEFGGLLWGSETYGVGTWYR